MNLPETTPLRTIRDFIRYALTRLSQSPATFNHGYDEPENEAVFLVMATLHIPLEYEEKYLDAALTESERQLVLNNISRRCDELEPTAYIVKEWWLTGFDFYVDERVLIPRSFIAELMEDRLMPWIKDPESVKSTLDLCCGSGCLAIIAAECFPFSTVDAVDISADALDVATINIERYGLEDRVFPIQSDLFENLHGAKYDLIISNPPYVTTASMQTLPGEYLHEPTLALEAGEDGMNIVKRIIENAHHFLNDNGILVVELGDGADAFKEIYPTLEVTWLPTSGGLDQVFLITKEHLPDVKTTKH